MEYQFWFRHTEEYLNSALKFAIYSWNNNSGYTDISVNQYINELICIYFS